MFYKFQKQIKFCLALLIIPIVSCSSQSCSEILNTFISHYNKKDSIAASKLLHEDFVELWKTDTVVYNKAQYANNYAWGKVMNDREDIEIIDVTPKTVTAMSTYYSDRDRLLEVGPYKQKYTYHFKDGKIIKIVGDTYSGYKAYDDPRRDTYERFFEWLDKEYGMTITDFDFTKEGALKLKKILLEYKKQNE